MSRIIQILDVVEEYVNKGDLSGLREFIRNTRSVILRQNQAMIKARQARIMRAVFPKSRVGDYACYDVKELYYTFSHETLKRLGLD
ncbi:hypothetical protein [Caldivirga sp.]|uniref:hypothetical protein n=1 Tax=Caldivirga sp. TaxID=2080243 RepID=UPI003D0BD688